MDLKPISPYAATKLSGEMLCQRYARVYGLSVIVLRLFSVYGPRQRPDLAIDRFTALLEAGKPLPIFGDGTTRRDYTYVDDVVSGVLAALDCKLQPDEKGGSYEVFNLGRSFPVKVIDLVRMLERVTRRKAVLDWMHPQAGDLPMTWADLSKSSRFLAYAPAIQLEEGLSKFMPGIVGIRRLVACNIFRVAERNPSAARREQVDLVESAAKDNSAAIAMLVQGQRAQSEI